jgi:hypothetical protein
LYISVFVQYSLIRHKGFSEESVQDSIIIYQIDSRAWVLESAELLPVKADLASIERDITSFKS